MFELFFSPEAWISLLTLTALEIILGIDNLVFIAIVTNRLAQSQQSSARQFGLLLACVTRLLLLATLAWMTKFTQPLFTLVGHVFSGRDLILILGGLFLLAKGTSELHFNVTIVTEKKSSLHRYSRFSMVIIQIMLLDIIFSLDSVITAVGMAQEFIIMALAIIIAIALMIWASGPLSHFINTYPNLKILGLSFLLLIGLVLVADGFGMHVPRAYLYFAIAFSVFVEWLNILANRWRQKKNSN
ncbi:TerC family protein [Rickettsiella endosymbiont of Rhagonycha lignosa]|uniref:TerC family protein n=1 Tax=Rickettsiella endosymbiont of Rhagonycha lignosa TaxID=3077937 RepID=UPI00313C72D0